MNVFVPHEKRIRDRWTIKVNCEFKSLKSYNAVVVVVFFCSVVYCNYGLGHGERIKKNYIFERIDYKGKSLGRDLREIGREKTTVILE